MSSIIGHCIIPVGIQSCPGKEKPAASVKYQPQKITKKFFCDFFDAWRLLTNIKHNAPVFPPRSCGGRTNQPRKQYSAEKLEASVVKVASKALFFG